MQIFQADPIQAMAPEFPQEYDTVNAELMKILISRDSFIIRTHYGGIFEILNRICSKFIFKLCQKYHIIIPSNCVYGKLLPYGSHELKTINVDSDIDFLLLAPKFVKKHHIFSKLYQLLESHKRIKNLRKIEEAYVPLIKFTIDNVKIDLTYAFINSNTIMRNIDIMDDRILYKMNPPSIISLNGVRSTIMLLDMVRSTPKKLFQYINRALKIWAKARFISGNVFGYFGGINFAIITTYVLQRTTSKKPSEILLEIFKLLSEWKWPKPLAVNQIEQSPDSSFQPWDMDLNSDDVMPIITPAFPAINSMRNATKSSLHHMMQEINRAVKYTERIVQKQAEWSQLFAAPHFFHDYKNFIEISCSSENENDQITLKGLVDKNIKNFSKLLESTSIIKYAIIFPHAFDTPDVPFSCTYYLALQFIYRAHNSSYSDSDPNSPSSPQSSSNDYHQQIINCWRTFSQNLLMNFKNMPTMNITIRFRNRSNLPNHVLQIEGRLVDQMTPPRTRINPLEDDF